jgi:hypothetical protein
MCNRRPPSTRLAQVCLDTVADIGVRVGIDVCHRRLLVAELRVLLADEVALAVPARVDIVRQLRQAITQLNAIR